MYDLKGYDIFVHFFEIFLRFEILVLIYNFVKFLLLNLVCFSSSIYV